ncbi:MAG: AAA family ATPase [Lentisphaerota bacterium]
MDQKQDKPADQEHEVVVSEQYTGNNARASWPFSLHAIRANMTHNSPEGREAMVSAFLWCTDEKHPIDKSEFARLVGYSENVLYKLYTGKYLHPTTKTKMDVPPDLIHAIKKFLELERERFLGGKNEFVVTPTAKKIFMACDLARESKTPVFLWGPSHIGKTWALEYYQADNNHGRTVYARMKAASGLGGMVKRISGKLGVSPNGNTSDLIDRIKNSLTPNMLLIIDELHLLMYTYRKESFFGCLEVIREIHDEVGCGMVLCGTQLLLEKINEGKHREMEQLLRRGVHRIPLPTMPTKADLAAIFKHSGLDFPDRKDVVTIQKIVEKPYDVVRQLARDEGLKAITERMRYGRKLAQRENHKFTWDHFIAAHLAIATEISAEEEWD